MSPSESLRQGPRPLGLHLSVAMWTWLSSATAFKALSGGLPISKAVDPALARAAERLAALGPERAEAALNDEIIARAAHLLTGLERYRRHPYRRDLDEPPALLAEGRTRVLDYAPGSDAPPVLIVPSLINRAYILDLSAAVSFSRWLAGTGLRPLVVDWGVPDGAELSFSLTDIIAGRLARLLDGVTAGLGRPVRLIGYCMGGLLAVALAQCRREAIERLVLLAAPWDFHWDGDALGQQIVAAEPFWKPMLAASGFMPVDVIQAMFLSLDSFSGVRKLSAFADADPGSPTARSFVALEDWLNDGIPLAGPVAAECVGDWYGRNTPARGQWRVAGQPVEPGALALPSLHVIPGRDRIVPPPSAHALADAMPGAERWEPPLGHIGLVTSRTAKSRLWAPLADWLRN